MTIAVVSTHDLLDISARVCMAVADKAYEDYFEQQPSVPDNCLCQTATSKGWLAQANHLLYNGLTTDQYLVLEGAASNAEMEHCNTMWMEKLGNLNDSCTADDRQRTSPRVPVKRHTRCALRLQIMSSHTSA